MLLYSDMCNRCEGEPYCGVNALFNGDVQTAMEYADRKNWLVVSKAIIVYLGVTSLRKEGNILFHGCHAAVASIGNEEYETLEMLSDALQRPFSHSM
jgi:hypothetical protein